MTPESMVAIARRHTRNLSAIVRRAERRELTGRNARATAASARWNLERALRAIVALEDAYGVDAAADVSDKLTAVRQRAVDAGVLSPADVGAAERRVAHALALEDLSARHN